MKPGKEEEVNLMKAGTNSTGTATHVIDTMGSDSGENGKKRKKKKVKKESKVSKEGQKKGSKKKSIKQEEADRERVERIRSENPSIAGDFIFKTMLERDPRKRRIKPALDRILESVAIETSSDDSDFDPGDKLTKSKGKKSIQDSDDDISESDEDGHQDLDVSSDDEDYDYELDSKRKKSKDVGLASLFKDDSSMAESSSQDNTAFSNRREYEANVSNVPRSGPASVDRSKVMSILVCAVCCGDISYDSDEIIECDSCGISVHENCYGVTGSDSEGEEEEDVATEGGDLRPVDLTIGNAATSPSKSHKAPTKTPTPPKGTPPSAKVSTPPTAKASTPPTAKASTPSKGTPPKSLAPKGSPKKGHSADAASTASSASTEPWFCDPCKSGLDPSFEDSLICELCPNPGGIFKMTVTGRWVHVVCALYTPGVAFLDTNRLDGMTLFELPSDRWGAKWCSICTDDRLAKTGLTICCDAGLCKTNFHVTCAQSEGLLLEAQSLNETEMVDPFYAHCKIHSSKDKLLVRKKRKNFHALLAKVRMLRSELAQAATGQNSDFTTGANGESTGANGDSTGANGDSTGANGDSTGANGDSTGANGESVRGNGESVLPAGRGRMNERSWKKLHHARARWYRRRADYAARFWRPQVKVPRSLATSSVAIRTLIKKTAFFGSSLLHDVDEFEAEAMKRPHQGQLLIKQTLQRMTPDAPTQSVFDLKPRKKIANFPDFSPEFVSYYFDRETRICEMGSRLSFLQSENERLKSTEMETRTGMELAMKEYESFKGTSSKTKEKTKHIWNLLNRMSFNHPMIVSPTSTPTKITLCTRKYYPKVLDYSPAKVSTVTTAPTPIKSKAAFKSYPPTHVSSTHVSSTHVSSTHVSGTHVSGTHVSGVGSSSLSQPPSLGQSSSGQTGFGHPSFGHPSSLLANHHSIPKPAVLKTCGKCSSTKDQHLLALCDKCHLYIHLHCLDPPLTRMPKKTRFGGWQCSDCTEKQVELEAEEIANGTLDRQIFGASRTVDSKRDSTDSVSGKRRLRKVPSKFAPETPGASAGCKKSPSVPTGGQPQGGDTVSRDGFKLTPSGKKRGRPLGCKTGMGTKKSNKHKAKKAKAASVEDGSGDPMTVSTDPGADQATSEPMVKVPEPMVKVPELELAVKVSEPIVKPKKVKQEVEEKECCKCSQTSSLKTLVQCDNCLLYYHWSCLDPPLKKSPKQRGYDWFCTDCDSSSEESDEDAKGDENGEGETTGSADSESDSTSESGSESGSSSESGSDDEGEN